MKKAMSIVLVLFLLMLPGNAFAAGFKLNISIASQSDGNSLGELWYNERLVWRLVFSPDGAQAASTNSLETTATITPDMIDGFFVVKIR